MADGRRYGPNGDRRRFLPWRPPRLLDGRRLRVILLAVVCSSAVVAVISCSLWLLAPAFVTDPMLVLEQQTPAITFVDRRGKVICQQRGWDYQWRFPVPLTDISPPVIQCLLAAEDSDFYQHHGVSYRAIARAAWQNLFSGTIVSGASTISMQLAGLSMPGKKRTPWWKFRQAAAARKLERHYSKDRILSEYLNRVLFGGKIHGIEAAAQYYFGLSARDLNWAEAALLCGLPQRPNAYRPDRHPARAKDRQRVVLHLLTRHGVISAEHAERILHHEPLRFRDFSQPPPFAIRYPSRYQHYFALARQEQPNALIYPCHLDTEYEGLIHHALTTQRNLLPNVSDAAAVLLDSQSGAVLALVGTLDFTAGQAGQVNAATATRSAGSTLKPFIYAEAIDGGIIVDCTVLLDAPLRYGDYSPGNYDGVFRGRVSATEALSLSLNTPAVRLLAKLGVSRMSERLHSIGLLGDAPSRQPDHAHGLSLVLGSAGHSLLNLTTAYAVLARSGQYRPSSFLKHSPAAAGHDATMIFTPGTCAMVSRMLRYRPLNGAGVDSAWKTGTANGNHDAWCITYTPDFTLGVWFGNKDGRAAAPLNGANAAAPCAAAIIAALYRNHQPPQWPDIYATLSATTLCAESGLAADSTCVPPRSGLQVLGVPLQRCSQCQQPQAAATLHILSPKPGTYLCGPDGNATIPLHSAEPSCLWFIDDQFIGALPPGASRPFPPGRHSVLIIDDQEGTRSARVTFTVRRKQ